MLRLASSTIQRVALPSARGLHQSALLLSQRAATFAQLRRTFGRKSFMYPSPCIVLISDNSGIRGTKGPRRGIADGFQIPPIRTSVDEQ